MIGEKEKQELAKEYADLFEIDANLDSIRAVIIKYKILIVMITMAS